MMNGQAGKDATHPWEVVMPQSKKFIIRVKNKPDVCCEFFIAGSDRDNLAILQNKGMEILVVSHAGWISHVPDECTAEPENVCDLR